MELLFMDGLPPPLGKGGIVRLLIEAGAINKDRIGKIVLHGGMATVEVADGWAARLVRALDGIQVETRHIRVWQQIDRSKTDHFAQLLRWLALEADAERQAVEAGQTSSSEATLTRLVIRAEDVGLGGRVLVQLSPRNQQAALPWSRLTVGSPVIVAEEKETQPLSWRGVISRLQDKVLEVACNQALEPSEAAVTFSVRLASDEIARQRMQRAMARVAEAQGNRTAQLRQVLLGQQTAEFTDKPLSAQVAPFVTHLNPSQQEAVRHAWAAQDVAIIHGPPGTGKTTTVTALIKTAVAHGQRVLACAPSNLAVDNLVEQLAGADYALVRIGHPVRVLPELQQYTLDALVEQHQDYHQAKKRRKEAFDLRRQAHKFRRARPEKGAKQAMRQEANALFDEARQLEARAVARILDQAQVIFSTLTAIDSTILGQRSFDLCVIDEAGQSVEPAMWIPLTRTQRLVLAGDHQQLPPTILSQQAQEEGFGVSLLEQLMQRDSGRLARRLDIQYRMHQQIMGFSSAEFYEDTLQAHPSVQSHRLCDLPGVADTPLTQEPVTFIDTAGASYDEVQAEESASRSNPQEAALVARKVAHLRQAGVLPQVMAVITPYAAQVQRLRQDLAHDIEIGSVDGFQGREKEVVIISLVRSNVAGQVGFLAETRRMNVALTRARRKLIVIGDSATITTHPFYARLVDYFERIGAYHSVWEEIDFGG